MMKKHVNGPVIARLLRASLPEDAPTFLADIVAALQAGELTDTQLDQIKAFADSDIQRDPLFSVAAARPFVNMVMLSHALHPDHYDRAQATRYLTCVSQAAERLDTSCVAYLLGNSSLLTDARLKHFINTIRQSGIDKMNKLFPYCDAAARSEWVRQFSIQAFFNPTNKVWLEQQIARDVDSIVSPTLNIWECNQSHFTVTNTAMELMQLISAALLKRYEPHEAFVAVEDEAAILSACHKLTHFKKSADVVNAATGAFLSVLDMSVILTVVKRAIESDDLTLTQFVFSQMARHDPARYAVLTARLFDFFANIFLTDADKYSVDKCASIIKQMTTAAGRSDLHKRLLELSKIMFYRFPFDRQCALNYYNNLHKVRYSLRTDEQDDEIFAITSSLYKREHDNESAMRYVEALESRSGVLAALQQALHIVVNNQYHPSGELEELMLGYARKKAARSVQSAQAQFAIAKMHHVASRKEEPTELAELFYRKAAQMGHPKALALYPEYVHSEPLAPAIDPSIFPSRFMGDLYAGRREDGSCTKTLCDWVRLLMMIVGVRDTVKVDGVAVVPEGATSTDTRRLLTLVLKETQKKIAADDSKTEEKKAQESQQWAEVLENYQWSDDYLSDVSVAAADGGILQRIDAGHVVQINDDWLDWWGAHVIGLTFFKANGQYYLIRSNKGAGAVDETPGLSIYHVGRIEGIATKSAVLDFIRHCKVTQFSENLDSSKHGGVGKYLELTKVCEFAKTPQKTGNCGTVLIVNYVLACLMAKYTQSQYGVVSAGAGEGDSIPVGFFADCYERVRDMQFKPWRALVREIGVEHLVELAMQHTHPVVMDKAEHIAMMRHVVCYLHNKYRAPKASEVWTDDQLIAQAKNKYGWFRAVDRLKFDGDKSPYGPSDFEAVQEPMVYK